MRVSDYIAKFLAKQNVKVVFAITGAGNVRLIESLKNEGIEYICPHHEQAGVMAALTRMRTSGEPAVCMVTGGPGATNTLIGVADAYLDSMPLIIIAGQENTEYLYPNDGKELRGYGVQGLDMPEIMGTVVKYATTITRAEDTRPILEGAFYTSYNGRPGPVWIDVPQNIQWAEMDPDTQLSFKGSTPSKVDMSKEIGDTLELIKNAERPLLWVGHGIRLAHCENTFNRVLNKLGIPALVSWAAADLLTDEHPLFVGRAGTYGQRFANLALQNCDLLITLGTRLALPQRGFDDMTFARGAKKVIVEIDEAELNKFKFKVDVPVHGNVADFLSALDDATSQSYGKYFEWKKKCADWKTRYPMATPPIDVTAKGINSYWFVDRLSDKLSRDHIIVTDMGTSLTCTHATIKLKDGQRIMTSTGLGEMGFGLPGAIGAQLGAKDRRVIYIGGEGSMMMNLQELQTLKNLNLPIKLFLLNNNGYLTIKHTHNALFQSNGNASACAPGTGVTFPDFEKIAFAFGIKHTRKETAEGLDEWIYEVINQPGAVIAEVMMPEFQELIPKASFKSNPDGSIKPSVLEDLYPFLTQEQLEAEMIIPLVK